MWKDLNRDSIGDYIEYYKGHYKGFCKGMYKGIHKWANKGFRFSSSAKKTNEKILVPTPSPNPLLTETRFARVHSGISFPILQPFPAPTSRNNIFHFIFFIFFHFFKKVSKNMKKKKEKKENEKGK